MPDQTPAEQERGGFLVILGEDRSTEIAEVGGKGASLGRLVKADFPVPSGFVVTTKAYTEFLRANGLEVKIEHIMRELDYGNLDRLEEGIAKIRDAITSSQLPDAFLSALWQTCSLG